MPVEGHRWSGHWCGFLSGLLFGAVLIVPCGDSLCVIVSGVRGVLCGVCAGCGVVCGWGLLPPLCVVGVWLWGFGCGVVGVCGFESVV